MITIHDLETSQKNRSQRKVEPLDQYQMSKILFVLFWSLKNDYNNEKNDVSHFAYFFEQSIKNR